MKRSGTTAKGSSLRDYDDTVIEATAIDACARLIMPYDAERAAALRRMVYHPDPGPGESLGLADQIKAGNFALWHERDSRYGAGVVREVTLDADTTGGIMDVEGTPIVYHDLMKIVIVTGGTFAEGVASPVTFSVYGKGSTGLKTVALVSAVTMNGSYQWIGNGMSVRFAPGVYKAADEWELEIRGGETEAGNSIRSVRVSLR
jgi:hypothetical protein